MNQFSIKDIENLSGIKAHTLRIWEQRYNILVPKRKDSNHRFYDDKDLKYLLRIAYLYHRGIKISKIARLKSDELNKVTFENFSTDTSFNHYINLLIEASLDFDEEKFEDVFESALQKEGIERVMLNVIYPYLEKIGVLWLTDHVIPAQEHFTSNLINRKIIIAIDALPKAYKQGGRTTLLFAPPKEHHEIPLLFIQYLLKKNGHRVIYYGTNVSMKDVQEYCELMPVTHLHFHLITNLTSLHLNEYVSKLTQQCPGKTIIVSGPKTKEVTLTFPDVRLLKTMNELLAYTAE
jgi:MerR family transcriptional regulator, light-induced transcriptional regulator